MVLPFGQLVISRDDGLKAFSALSDSTLDIFGRYFVGRESQNTI